MLAVESQTRNSVGRAEFVVDKLLVLPDIYRDRRWYGGCSSCKNEALWK